MTPELDRLARTHFPHLPPQDARQAVIRLLDDLSADRLRQARAERHHAR